MGKWNKEKIETLCYIGRGRVISQNELNYDGIYPVFSSQSYNNGEMGKINTYDFDGEYVTWTTDGAYAGTVFYRSGKFNCTNVCGTLKSKGNINTQFLSYQLGAEAKKHVSYIGNPKLMNNILAAIKITFPESIKEQEKIAEILTEVDVVIDKTTTLIDKYKYIKEGLLQDLLTNGIDEKGNIRSPKTHEYKHSPLGMIPVEWDCVSVANTFKLRARIGWQGLKAKEFVDDGPFVVTGTDLKNGEINWETCYHVSEFRYKQDIGIQLKNHDLVITKDGTIGKTAMVNNCPEKVTLNSGLFVIRPTDNSVMTGYLYLILNSRLFEVFMKNILTGSTIKHLNQCEFYKLLYARPSNMNQGKCFNEQQLIVDTLQSIDIKIRQEQQQLSKYQSIKKGLMQDLLNHKVSVDCLL